MKESNNRQSGRNESSETRSESMRGHVNNPEGRNGSTGSSNRGSNSSENSSGRGSSRSESSSNRGSNSNESTSSRSNGRGNNESSQTRSEAMRGHVNNPEGHNQYTKGSDKR